MSAEPEDEAEAAEAPAPDPVTAGDTPAPPGPPRRRKKRRKRAASTEALPVEDHEEPGEGDGRAEVAAFARAFPRDPALDALVSAFDAGDYARVRREAPALAKATDRDDVRAAARELARRLDPDPLAVYLLGGAAVLLAFLAAWYWSHPHVP
jgi:hypothetical protein